MSEISPDTGSPAEISLADLRKEYTREGLSREDLHEHPMEQFRKWFDQACSGGLNEPNAMVLATVSPEGQPSQRTVLLKYYDRGSLVFFTNYESRKASEIEGNPRVSLLFPWLGMERQVTIQGTCERISRGETLKYFSSRPTGSQLGAWVSRQSQVISRRSLLLQKLDEVKRKFADGKIPLPDFWGGYRCCPQSVEFWQGRPNRLHDRFLYQKQASGWIVERLAP